MASKISVIIPNWNGKYLLNACLKSLSAQSYQDFETVVVDNGSIDGSKTMIKREFPDVNVIDLDHNHGFSVAVNRGIKRAESPYILVLNNDLELDMECLRLAYEHIIKESDACGGLQCRMMKYDQREIIDSLGIQIRNRRFYDLGRGTSFSARMHHEGIILGPCAGAALYRRKFFEEVGLFDEHFFAGFEDVDLALRGLRGGWYFKYEPRAVVYHHRSATFDSLSFRKRMELLKNYFLVGYKNFPRKYLLKMSISLLYNLQKDMFDFVSHIRKKRYAFIIGAYYELFRTLPGLLKERHVDDRDDKAILMLFSRSENQGIW